MNTVRKIILSIGVVVGFGSAVVGTTPAGAVNAFEACNGNSSSTICKSTDDKINGLIKNIVNILIYLTGTIAVIMIIIAGIRYVTSNGDSAGITGAKNTILYAIIGLVVAVMAYVIVNFVLTSVTSDSSSPRRSSVSDRLN